MAYLPSLTSGSIYRQAATRKPSSITSAFMSQVDQKAARSGIRSKSIPTPRPQARTGSISGPTSGTLFSATTPSACTFAQAFSASPGTPSATAQKITQRSPPRALGEIVKLGIASIVGEDHLRGSRFKRRDVQSPVRPKAHARRNPGQPTRFDPGGVLTRGH